MKKRGYQALLAVLMLVMGLCLCAPIEQFVTQTEKTYADYSEFNIILLTIGRADTLSVGEKLNAIYYEYNKVIDKTDINIPAEEQYVKDFDAEGHVEYDWPKEIGFIEESIKPITREDPLPENWDRYGYMGGSNFASVSADGSYTYSERAIPYVQNPNAYHTGTFKNDTYFDKIDAIRSGDLVSLNAILEKENIESVDDSYFEELIEDYNYFIESTKESVGDEFDATYGLHGEAASWDDMVGGASQYVTPLNGNILIRLGICQEKNKE